MNKILSSIVFLAMIICITGCNKDDENGSSASLIGTWILVSESAAGCTDSGDNYTETYTCDASECIKFVVTATQITYTYTSSFGDYEETYSYSTSGTNITFDGETASYSVSGNNLSIFNTDTTDGCTYTTILTKSS